MNIKSLLNHHCDRAYALTGLLEVTYEQADNALNEGTDDPRGVLERVKNLLHGAQELSDSLTVSVNELYVKALEGQSDEKGSPIVGLTKVADLGVTFYTLGLLEHSGISTVRKLLDMTELDLLQLSGASPNTIANIKERLAVHGLSLAEDR